MNKVEIRKAVPSDLDQIYLMGFDVWADGSAEADYLNTCRTSPKYKRGTWYALAEGADLLSSLIVYELGDNKFGIGSIATPKALRTRGLASKLISGIVEELQIKFPEAVFFLHSDIDPEFYEKFGFTKLPAEAQRYKTTNCMVRGKNAESFYSDKLMTPEYF
jgi:predicted N-acetyltransferase YhbS